MVAQKRCRAAQQVFTDVPLLAGRQAVANEVITQRHFQNAVGFAQRLGVHLARSVVGNIAVDLIAGIDIRVAHQQRANFIAIRRFACQPP